MFVFIIMCRSVSDFGWGLNTIGFRYVRLTNGFIGFDNDVFALVGYEYSRSELKPAIKQGSGDLRS